MGNKLVWLGLTLLVAVPHLTAITGLAVAGALIMVVGCALVLLDK